MVNDCVKTNHTLIDWIALLESDFQGFSYFILLSHWQPSFILMKCNCLVQSLILVGGGWMEARCQGKSSTANPKLSLKSPSFSKRMKASMNASQVTFEEETLPKVNSFFTVSKQNCLMCEFLLCFRTNRRSH